MTEHADRIELEAPLAGAFQAVVRLIIGGIAERVDFAFEEIDDLQLAVERLLAEAGAGGQRVHLLRGRAATASAPAWGRCSEHAIAEALQTATPAPAS